MEKNIFRLAEQYLKERTDIEKYEPIPAPINSQTMTYCFKSPEEAIAAISVLLEMIDEHNLKYVRAEIMITPYKNIVALEDGDEEWDYDEEKE